MHRGYIKIWRKIRESFIWKDAEIVKLFLHLILEANYKDTEFMFNGKKQILRRGQLITGRKKLSLSTGVSESKIYRALSCLESEQLIEQQKFNLYSIITMVSYDTYQQSEQLIEQPANNQRTTSEQPVNTSKELITTKKKIYIDQSSDWYQELSKDFPNINITDEYRKAMVWEKDNSRINHKKFFKNWLINAKPINKPKVLEGF